MRYVGVSCCIVVCLTDLAAGSGVSAAPRAEQTTMAASASRSTSADSLSEKDFAK
jgi:hypothetical protein